MNSRRAFDSPALFDLDLGTALRQGALISDAIEGLAVDAGASSIGLGGAAGAAVAGDSVFPYLAPLGLVLIPLQQLQDVQNYIKAKQQQTLMMVLQGLQAQLMNMLQMVRQAWAESYLNATHIDWLNQVEIPNIINGVYSAIQSEIANEANQRYQSDVNIWHGLEQLNGSVYAELQQLQAHMVQLFSQAEIDAQNGDVRSEQYTQALFTQLQGYVQTTFHTLEVDIQQQVQQAETQAQQQLQSTAHTLQQQQQAGDQSILNYLGSAIVPAISTVTGTALQTQQQLRQWLQECGDPLCQNLNNYGNQVQGLLGLGLFGLLLALIAELIHNPQAVVPPVRDVVQPVVINGYDNIAGQVGAPAA